MKRAGHSVPKVPLSDAALCQLGWLQEVAGRAGFVSDWQSEPANRPAPAAPEVLLLLKGPATCCSS